MHVLLASGSNAAGQLANGTILDSHVFTPCLFSHSSDGGEDLANIYSVRHVAAGARHALLLLERRNSGKIFIELWGCGDGSRGQLGHHYTESLPGSSTSTSTFRLIQLPSRILHDGYTHRLIASSWETSYVVLSCSNRNDVLVSMGADDFGNLGIPRKEKRDLGSVHTVDFNEILPPGTVQVVVESLAAGLYHIVVHLNATLADGSVRGLTAGWGSSRHGQLGKISTPIDNGRPHVFSLEDMHDPVVSLGLGMQHSVLLHASGRISGLGSGKKNQLQGIHDQRDVRALGCTWNGTYVVVESEGEFRMMATGSYSKGQLGRPIPEHRGTSEDIALAPVQFPFTSRTHRFVRMACGSEHVLALFEITSPNPTHKTEVWGWGWNEHGNLGTGTTDDLMLPQRIWPTSTWMESTAQETAVGIWAGCGTSWIAIQRPD